jgi:hypothetical protein
MAIERLNNMFWTPPVNKEQDQRNKKRQDPKKERKNDRKKGNENKKDEEGQDKPGKGKIDIKV